MGDSARARGARRAAEVAAAAVAVTSVATSVAAAPPPEALVFPPQVENAAKAASSSGWNKVRTTRLPKLDTKPYTPCRTHGVKMDVSTTICWQIDVTRVSPASFHKAMCAHACKIPSPPPPPPCEPFR
ncbi:hypothetical protein Vafri_18118 [Volvox africanus]|uniref:Uncharacterized protein n=1 Tax=Volvox africanus TaxID=51714 RepID=A0A8J4BMF8_9CHLO|nr:hypothetical protein Vafri_18118 [Volvox africanus]